MEAFKNYINFLAHGRSLSHVLFYSRVKNNIAASNRDYFIKQQHIFCIFIRMANDGFTAR